MVDAFNLVAQRAEDAHQRRADDCRHQVSDMKRLGDVRPGVIDNDGLARAFAAAAEALAGVADQLRDRCAQRARLDAQVHEGSGGRNFLNDVLERRVALEFLRKLSGSGRRRLFRGLGDGEAREGIVAHLGLRRTAELREHVGGRKSRGGRQRVDQGCMHGMLRRVSFHGDLI
jgi:hypothetical protein